MSEQIWTNAATAVIRAGSIPLPLSETIIELIKSIMTEEQAKFVPVFNGSLNYDQLREQSGMDRNGLDSMLESLMRSGVIVGTPSRGSGKIVYRLMGPFPGLFEFTMMRGGTGEKEKRQASLFNKLFNELVVPMQKNYDQVVEAARMFPPVVRVVPVEAEIDLQKDTVLPTEEVDRIVDKFDVIALTNCYCRHQKELIGEPCKVTSEKKNCLLFGKSAQFAIDYSFGEPVSKEEARRIIHESQKEGLMHKAFHVHLDPNREEEAICNCCKCCCGTFQLFYKGAVPLHHLASYLAYVEAEKCAGCETCVDACPMEAIEMKEGKASIIEERCIGCGVCVVKCGDNAIHLKKTGLRNVYVPPRRL